MLPTVVMIGENRYATLDAAIKAAQKGDTIVLLEDADYLILVGHDTVAQHC